MKHSPNEENGTTKIFSNGKQKGMSSEPSGESTISVRPPPLGLNGAFTPSSPRTLETSNWKEIWNFGIRNFPTETSLVGRWRSRNPDSELALSSKDGSPSMASGRKNSEPSGESTISVRPPPVGLNGATTPSSSRTLEPSNWKDIWNFGIRNFPTETIWVGRWRSRNPDSELALSSKDGSPSMASGRKKYMEKLRRFL
nr:hypothetical protein Iba_chr14cCG12890 [Ipomoea batatas]